MHAGYILTNIWSIICVVYSFTYASTPKANIICIIGLPKCWIFIYSLRISDMWLYIQSLKQQRVSPIYSFIFWTAIRDHNLSSDILLRPIWHRVAFWMTYFTLLDILWWPTLRCLAFCDDLLYAALDSLMTYFRMPGIIWWPTLRRVSSYDDLCYIAPSPYGLITPTRLLRPSRDTKGMKI